VLVTDHDRRVQWRYYNGITYGFMATWFFAESPIRRSVSVNATYSAEHHCQYHFSLFFYNGLINPINQASDACWYDGDGGAMVGQQSCCKRQKREI